MKKLIIISVFCLSFFFSNAQFNFGIKGGVNANKFIIDQTDFLSSDMTFNPQGGLFFRFQADHLFIMPEILYVQKNGGFTYKTDSMDANYKVGYIDVPVMIGVHFLVFNVHTGPVVSFLVNEDISFDVNSTGASVSLSEDIFNEVSFGWQAGLSIEVDQFILEGRYEFSVADLMKDFKVPDTDVTLSPDGRNSIFQITLGIKFLKPKSDD